MSFDSSVPTPSTVEECITLLLEYCINNLVLSYKMIILVNKKFHSLLLMYFYART